MPGDDGFPALVCCVNLHAMKDSKSTVHRLKGPLRWANGPKADGALFDVKFYPYPTVDGDQIFAAAGEREIFIGRMLRDGERPFEILRWFGDGDVRTCFTGVCDSC